MKFLTTALTLTVISAQCFAGSATIITAASPDRNKAPEISMGFSDSSFDYGNGNDKLRSPEDKSMCYIGDAAAVCEIIQNYANELNAQRSRGQHDGMNVESCTVSRSKLSVRAIYNLTDDYDSDIRVNREIKSCK